MRFLTIWTVDAVLYVQLQQPLVRSLLTISYVTLDSRITRVYPWKLSTKRFTEQLMGQVHRLSYLNGLENLHPSELQTSTNISPWPTGSKIVMNFEQLFRTTTLIWSLSLIKSVKLHIAEQVQQFHLLLSHHIEFSYVMEAKSQIWLCQTQHRHRSKSTFLQQNSI